MEEFWKPCLENYEISNFGNVRRKLMSDGYKVVNCSIMNRGYKYFQTRRGKKRNNHLIHHLVAYNFIGERPDNQVIDHIDRNKLNNNVSNLRYCTQKTNCSNHNRYVAEIEETDLNLRHTLLCKRYVELNREKVLKNKKEYYQTNKTKMLEKYKDETYSIVCSVCEIERFVGRCSFNRIKRTGVNSNICKVCSSKINLAQK